MPEISDERLDELLAAAEKTTPGPWELDEIENHDDRGRFTSYAVAAIPSWSPDHPKHVVDTLNSGVMEIQTEHDEDGSSSWDEQGRADAAYIAMCDPATISTLIAEVKAARAGEGVGEPVAWRWRHSGGPWRFLDNGALPDDRDAYITSQPGYEVRPVYASPTGNSEHGGVSTDACPICAIGFKPDDMCETDIELGTCHAECLAGSPLVDLETGEPLPEGSEWPAPFRYAPSAPLALRDTTIHLAAKAIKSKVPVGYGMADSEAEEYARAALTAASVQQGKGDGR